MKARMVADMLSHFQLGRDVYVQRTNAKGEPVGEPEAVIQIRNMKLADGFHHPIIVTITKGNNESVK